MNTNNIKGYVPPISGRCVDCTLTYLANKLLQENRRLVARLEHKVFEYRRNFNDIYDELIEYDYKLKKDYQTNEITFTSVNSLDDVDDLPF